jgi:ATP-dependent Lon protease
MSNPALDQKIREVFGEFAVDKSLVRRLGLSGDDRHVPSYVMDWIITHKSRGGATTHTLQRGVLEFIQNHLPAKGEKERVKFRLSQGETLTILDAISVRVELGHEVQYLATIPCLDEKKAKISEEIIRENEALLRGSTWGAAKICFDSADEGGGIKIIYFKPMQTGQVSLDVFCESRRAFTVEEWLDVLIRTMGYEPTKYGKSEKLWMLCRLIPIVHNRVNMMELAPAGSGKSYVFNNISRHVWLTAAQISPAVLFYNRQSKAPGLLTRYDLLVLDEAQSIRFTDPAETQAQLKGYLEQGVYTRGDCAATAECGFMLLANIDLRRDPVRRYHNGNQAFLPARPDYIRRLPEMFLESPLLDRFHGIIPGWEIPSFAVDQQANGFGLKADYFAEVCHAMRSASDLAQNVRAKLRLSGGKRDCTAIERLACGLAKLLLIGPDDPAFDELVIAPAEEMRRLVRAQLNAIDAEGYPSQLQIIRIGAAGKSTTALGRISRYELLEEIAKGGMAVVYKGLDTQTGTIVAIKKVATAGTQVDEAALRREIDIYERLKQIPNPHILAVRDIFREGGTYALVTEYADGGSLWDLLGGGIPDQERVVQHKAPLDESTVREIALAVLDALIALHENDIVHRDIKPQNVLRCDDTWKVADFGISKLRNNPVTGFTFQGAHTIPWAPPEQIEGAPAHPSADIYSFGRVTSFLLTGSQDKSSIQKVPQHWAEILIPCVDISPRNRPDVHFVRSVIEQFSL